MATGGYKNFKWYKPRPLFHLLFIPICNPIHIMDAEAIWVRKGIIGGIKPIKFKIEERLIETSETQDISVLVDYDIHDSYKVSYYDLNDLQLYFNDIRNDNSLSEEERNSAEEQYDLVCTEIYYRDELRRKLSNIDVYEFDVLCKQRITYQHKLINIHDSKVDTNYLKEIKEKILSTAVKQIIDDELKFREEVKEANKDKEFKKLKKAKVSMKKTVNQVVKIVEKKLTRSKGFFANFSPIFFWQKVMKIDYVTFKIDTEVQNIQIDEIRDSSGRITRPADTVAIDLAYNVEIVDPIKVANVIDSKGENIDIIELIKSEISKRLDSEVATYIKANGIDDPTVLPMRKNIVEQIYLGARSKFDDIGSKFGVQINSIMLDNVKSKNHEIAMNQKEENAKRRTELDAKQKDADIEVKKQEDINKAELKKINEIRAQFPDITPEELAAITGNGNIHITRLDGVNDALKGIRGTDNPTPPTPNPQPIAIPTNQDEIRIIKQNMLDNGVIDASGKLIDDYYSAIISYRAKTNPNLVFLNTSINIDAVLSNSEEYAILINVFVEKQKEKNKTK